MNRRGGLTTEGGPRRRKGMVPMGSVTPFPPARIGLRAHTGQDARVLRAAALALDTAAGALADSAIAMRRCGGRLADDRARLQGEIERARHLSRQADAVAQVIETGDLGAMERLAAELGAALRGAPAVSDRDG